VKKEEENTEIKKESKKDKERVRESESTIEKKNWLNYYLYFIKENKIDVYR